MLHIHWPLVIKLDSCGPKTSTHGVMLGFVWTKNIYTWCNARICMGKSTHLLPLSWPSCSVFYSCDFIFCKVLHWIRCSQVYFNKVLYLSRQVNNLPHSSLCKGMVSSHKQGHANFNVLVAQRMLWWLNKSGLLGKYLVKCALQGWQLIPCQLALHCWSRQTIPRSVCAVLLQWPPALARQQTDLWPG